MTKAVLALGYNEYIVGTATLKQAELVKWNQISARAKAKKDHDAIMSTLGTLNT